MTLKAGRKKTVPKKNAKKVDKNIEYIELQFSEPMDTQWWTAKSTGDEWKLSSETPHEWSADRKTMRFYRDESGDPLEANTTIEIILNAKELDEEFYFRDLKGNLMKAYKFKFTTGD